MDLHLAFELRAPANATPHHVQYQEMLDMASWADVVGFDFVNFGEHHVSASGYNPSPLITCAGVAGRTRRIRMRPNILIAPLYDPIKLAEDTAVLSLMSGGRFDICIGGGYRQQECDMFDKPLDGRWKAVGETARVLKAAWTGKPFEYEGRTITVRPVPHRAPTLSLGGMSPAAARRAARIADDFSSPLIPDLWDAYRAACLEIGKPDPGPEQARGPVFLWIAEDVDAAWNMLMPHVLGQIEEYAHFTTEAYGEPAGPYAGKPDAETARHNPAYQVLTPEQAIELGGELGADGFLLFNPLMGGIPPHEAWRMLKLLERSVMPYLPRHA